jgi:RNA polymerase sigma factor (sigma-70 family)
MAAAQAGEGSAYNVLLRQCIPIIRAVARRTGAPGDCLDDIVQETLMTIHHARHTYDPSRPFITWVSALARRRSIDVLRRCGRTRGREIHAPLIYENHPDTARTPEQHMDALSRRAVLDAAVGQLPEAQRDAVLRLVMNDQSLAEASSATNRTKIAIKVNLHRALAALRALVTREER